MAKAPNAVELVFVEVEFIPIEIAPEPFALALAPPAKEPLPADWLE